MPEINLQDVQETRKSSSESFRMITPEKGTMVNDAVGYWNDVFNDTAGIEKTKTSAYTDDRTYYDDNGKVYRINDSLEPNCRFEVRGYIYETDGQGRTICAEGKLRIREPDYIRHMDSMAAVGKGDQKEGDHRAHYIAHEFGGSDGIENLSPMKGELNQKDYAKIENKLVDAVKDGADVRLKVEPQYEGTSVRPTEYKMSYSINGEREVVIFRNGTESKA